MATRSNYMEKHAIQLMMEANQSEEKEVSCLFTYETIHQHNRRETISYLVLGAANQPISMKYMNLEAAEIWFVTQRKSCPLTRSVPRGALRLRIEMAIAAKHAGPELAVEEIPALFHAFLTDPASFKRTADYQRLRLDLHMGDTGALSDWIVGDPLELRTEALKALGGKPRGSWLIRNASIQSTNVVTVQCLSFVHQSQLLDTSVKPYREIPADVKHALIGHIPGYGYIIVDAERGDVMPSMGGSVPMPKHDTVWPCFLDMLEWFAKDRMVLSSIVRK